MKWHGVHSQRQHVAPGRTGQNRDQTEQLHIKKQGKELISKKEGKRGSWVLSTFQEAGEQIFKFGGILHSALSCLDGRGVKSPSPHILQMPLSMHRSEGKAFAAFLRESRGSCGK